MRKEIQHLIDEDDIEHGKFEFEGNIYEIIDDHNDRSLITTVTPFWSVYLTLLEDSKGKRFKAYIYSYSKSESGRTNFVLESMKEV